MTTKKGVLVGTGIAIVAAFCVLVFWTNIFKEFSKAGRQLNNYVEFEEQEKVTIIEEESFFGDFKVENGKVHIYCELALKNNYEEKVTAIPYAIMKKDKKAGLLTQEKLYACNSNGDIQKIKLNAGEKVSGSYCFTGDYGGNPHKADRLLPEIRFEYITAN